MAKILLLADEIQGARMRSDLEYIGYPVQHVVVAKKSRGRSGFLDAVFESVDVVVMDGNGVENVSGLVQEVRRCHRTEPAFLLVATGESTAPDLDFPLGIDDFMMMPYSIRELDARMRLALWRGERVVDDPAIRVDGLVINPDRYDVRIDGSVVELTLREYELLKHLVTHRGRVFTRAELLDKIWGADYIRWDAHGGCTRPAAAGQAGRCGKRDYHSPGGWVPVRCVMSVRRVRMALFSLDKRIPAGDLLTP